MTTTQTDIENYQKFGDSKKGSAVFANTLVEKLRQRFPQREFRVRHYDPHAMSDYSGQAECQKVTDYYMGNADIIRAGLTEKD